MKKLIILMTAALFVSLSTMASATTITVAGSQVRIPNKYNSTRVQNRANRCVAANITKVKTDKAAEMLPLVCTEAVLTYGPNWAKHM